MYRRGYIGSVPTPRPARFRAAVLAAALCTAAGAAPAAAQPPAGGGRGPYERALRLVESGRGGEGRALTDSLVAAAGPGSPVLAEALWWRAALAADAGAAERDLRRLLDEVPASPRVGPATVRLAQLALLRDRPDEAASLLDPLARGRAGDPVRPLAGYWLARARLERRDPAGACAALDGAAAPPVLDADLARQVAALRRRVPGCAGAAVAVAPPPTAPAPSTPAPAVAPSAAATPGAGTASPQPASAPSASPPSAGSPAAPAPVATAAPAGASSGLPTATGPRAGAASAQTPPGAAPTPTAPVASRAGTPTAPARPAPVRGPVFAVQLAAYDRRADAAALVARLRAVGLDAFAEGQGAAGDAPPFRVKVGRYATRTAAAAALADLRGRGQAGFVTTALPAAPGAAPP